MKVLDMNGNVILKGQTVIVHQDEGEKVAMVVEPLPHCPTVNQKGHWVDIDSGEGVEGMMSYILEVVLC